MQLAPDSATVIAGDTLALRVTLRDSSGAVLLGRTVIWRTGDPFVATVAGNGVVQGISVGNTAVWATAGGHADTVTVFVTPVYFTAVSSGAVHTCAVANSQIAYCWGDNTRGQDGTGSGELQEPTPRAVAGATRFVLVAAGGDHTCARAATGAASCWGRNDQGQLGRGTTPGDATVPAPVATGLRFTSLSAGSSHTCAMATDAFAYCWGANTFGQLGTGGASNGTTPLRVIADAAFTAVAAGADHTCGLAADGAAYCWGANPLGQIGDSSRLTRTFPAAVAGGLRFTTLSAGGVHTCGLTGGGTAYCWGGNAAGQLGTGTADSLEWTPQPVTGGLTFRAISAGGSHTCALTADSLAYCWGDDADGQLGDSVPTTQSSAAPVPVAGGLRFADLRAGASHTCAITGSLVVYCWGLGLQGQLGQVAPHSSRVPLRVAGQP